ncbi:PAS and ANTAR domain-containing protein [Isoptericola croceus]|uniref:PAS and ANTAR domain-containing protein n=1 Tax=Isoptericola croceus TaxID=3031406 RepID=UPI0023F96751|nr:PAS and ANTAR domain-containing protein [Isoptericola croceus]
MTSPLPHHHAADALALGDSTLTGRYHVDLLTHEWWWSDETFRIHGFEPGEVVPTTAMVLAHRHPEDRDRVQHVLDDARRTGDPFATVHRIIDAHGVNHVVSIVGEGRRDEHGETVELVGYVLDLTSSIQRLASKEADIEIRAAAHGRRHIEQAKAVVGLALELDDDVAFDVLRRRSNDTNVPVRLLSKRLVQHVHATATDGRPLEAARVLAFLKAPSQAD